MRQLLIHAVAVDPHHIQTLYSQSVQNVPSALTDQVALCQRTLTASVTWRRTNELLHRCVGDHVCVVRRCNGCRVDVLRWLGCCRVSGKAAASKDFESLHGLQEPRLACFCACCRSCRCVCARVTVASSCACLAAWPVAYRMMLVGAMPCRTDTVRTGQRWVVVDSLEACAEGCAAKSNCSYIAYNKDIKYCWHKADWCVT